MPDGTELAASLYLPKNPEGPLATVLVRLPYGRLDYSEGYGSGMFFAKHGYAVLVEELRGTGESGGEFVPWRDADTDGAATLELDHAQPGRTARWVRSDARHSARRSWCSRGKATRPTPAMIPSGAGGAIGTLQRRTATSASTKAECSSSRAVSFLHGMGKS
jgi:hypothetical protein